MIEQIIYIALGIIGITILVIVMSILSNKLNVNYAVVVMPTLLLFSTTIYAVISIKVANIGSNTNGIIAGCILGLFNSTIGILIARKFNANTEELKDFKWKIKPIGVFLGLVISGTISIISIYIYNKIY